MASGQLREDFDLYLGRARVAGDFREANVWHQMAERAQKVIVSDLAIEEGGEPGEIARTVALLSGDPVQVMRRLVVTHGLATVRDALAEVEQGMEAERPLDDPEDDE